MKIKSNIKLVQYFAVHLLAVAGSGHCLAAYELISFAGTVTSDTCGIASASRPVSMPSVSTYALPTAGSTAGQVSFTLNLTGCSAGLTGANPYFEGSFLVNSSGRRLVASGTTINTVLQLLKTDGTAINLAGGPGAQNAPSAPIAGSTGSITMHARYCATCSGSAGSFSTKVTYSTIVN